VIASLLLALPGARGEDRVAAEGIRLFEEKIEPVLKSECYRCHSADADKVKAGLRLDSRAGVLKGGDTGPAIVPKKGADSLLLLIAFESEQKRALVGWRALEHVVTTHVPSEHWVGAYDVVPVPAVELRKRLLELLPGNDSNHPAARCLNNIDKIRDHYGAPESEPRHPNLASGRA
jgi:hypothetical protein